MCVNAAIQSVPTPECHQLTLETKHMTNDSDKVWEDQEGSEAKIIIKNYHGPISVQNNYFGRVPLVIHNTRNANISNNYIENSPSTSYSVSASRGAKLIGNRSIKSHSYESDESIGFDLTELSESEIQDNKSEGNNIGYKIDGLYDSIFRDNTAIGPRAIPTLNLPMDVDALDDLAIIIRRIKDIIRLPYNLSGEILNLRQFIYDLEHGAIYPAAPQIIIPFWNYVFKSVLETQAGKLPKKDYQELEDLLWSMNGILIHLFSRA